LLQQAHDLGQGQNHLDIWILFDRDPAELLHGSLLFNLVSLLQATLSFFLGGKNDRRLIMANGLRVATFYDLPDILQPLALVVRLPRALRTASSMPARSNSSLFLSRQRPCSWWADWGWLAYCGAGSRGAGEAFAV